MESVMSNGFAELSANEMEAVDGGKSINWGEIGYKIGYGWCSFWGNVGSNVYDLINSN